MSILSHDLNSHRVVLRSLDVSTEHAVRKATRTAQQHVPAVGAQLTSALTAAPTLRTSSYTVVAVSIMMLSVSPYITCSAQRQREVLLAYGDAAHAQRLVWYQVIAYPSTKKTNRCMRVDARVTAD